MASEDEGKPIYGDKDYPSERRTHGEERLEENAPQMDRQVFGGFAAFMAVAVLVTLFAALFRLAVPSILASTIPGATLLAAPVALFGTFGIALLALILFSRIAKLLSK